MDQPLFDRVRAIAADVFQLEEEFGFEFAPEEMDQMKTIGRIAQVAAAKRNV